MKEKELVVIWSWNRIEANLLVALLAHKLHILSVKAVTPEKNTTGMA